VFVSTLSGGFFLLVVLLKAVAAGGGVAAALLVGLFILCTFCAFAPFFASLPPFRWC
jgi:hypothetical protein